MLHHENIVQFIGAVMDPQPTFLLHEYCSKGSLQVRDFHSYPTNCRCFLLQHLLSLLWSFSYFYLHSYGIPRTYVFLSSSSCRNHIRFQVHSSVLIVVFVVIAVFVFSVKLFVIFVVSLLFNDVIVCLVVTVSNDIYNYFEQ